MVKKVIIIHIPIVHQKKNKVYIYLLSIKAEKKNTYANTHIYFYYTIKTEKKNGGPETKLGDNIISSTRELITMINELNKELETRKYEIHNLRINRNTILTKNFSLKEKLQLQDNQIKNMKAQQKNQKYQMNELKQQLSKLRYENEKLENENKKLTTEKNDAINERYKIQEILMKKIINLN